MRRDGPRNHFVSDDPSLIRLDLVHRWLSEQAYWSLGRSRQTVAESIERSLVFGLYEESGQQVGFARCVTDRVTFAWLCDVFVEVDSRSAGLGSFLVETVLDHPALRGVRIVLAQDPARSLYERHGFSPLTAPERWRERAPRGS